MYQSKRDLRALVRSFIREQKCDHIRIILFESDEEGIQTITNIIQQASSQLMVNNRYSYNTVVDDYIVQNCEAEDIEVLIEPIYDER